jgi:large subunit ribosomal protein L29
MKVGEIRSWSTDEIRSKIDQTLQAMFNMRFQAAVGQLEDFNRLRALRRDVARMKTILRERELAAQANVAQGGNT